MNNNILNEYSNNLFIDIVNSYDIIHNLSWKESGAKFTHDVWVVKQGRIYIEQDGEIITLEKGDIFMHYPARLYTAYTDDAGCEFIYTRFNIKLWGEYVDTTDINMYGKFPAELLKDEYCVYIKAHKMYEKSEFMSVFMLRAALELIVGKCISCAQLKSPQKIYALRDKGARIESSLKYISENIHRKIAIEEIASQVGMSEKYFISFFRKAIGKSPYNYITSTKMQMAYNRLATGKYQVSEVADSLGYSDIYTFSKAFKKHFGQNPSKVFDEAHN